ncbi:MAG: hypothetical protein KDA20_06835 [Phycisphaerales bacterium]|nr:hypothetical protein [Phycisphaerales bacterium]
MTNADADKGERHGVALGPMTFVPELRVAGTQDPWAHRKGEPRVFALLWAVYLLVAAVLTVFSVRALGYPRTSQFVFGGLSMLTLALVGIMLLWPALRLCQAKPALPTTSALLDLAVVLLPVHAIVWPLSMLTGWPWTVTVGLLLLVTGWGMVAAGVIAITVQQTQRGGVHASRLLAIIVLLVLCIAPPAFRVLAMQAGHWAPSLVDLASPLSAPWALALAPEGYFPVMTRQGWLASIVPVGIGSLLLVVSGLVARFSPHDEATQSPSLLGGR